MTHEAAGQELAIDAGEAEQMHEAMDYAQHRATWDMVTRLVKWSIIELALVILALFCFVEAEQPVLGSVLLLVAVLAVPGNMLFRSRA